MQDVVYFLITISLLCNAFDICENGLNTNEFCYIVSTSIANQTEETWQNAEDVCQQMSGHLVSILSKHENDLILKMVNGTLPIWIGLRNHDPQLDHFWTDYSCEFNEGCYQNFLPDQRIMNDLGIWKSCTEMYLNDGSARIPVACQNKKHFVCKKSINGTQFPTPSTPLHDQFGCDSDWSEFNDRCFKVITQEATYEDALTNCQSMDQTHNNHSTRSTLVAIRDAKDQEFLMTILWQVDWPWIGVVQSDSGYMWTDDLTPFEYQNWKTIYQETPPVQIETIPSHFGKWFDTYQDPYPTEPRKHPYICMQYKHYDPILEKPFASLNTADCPTEFACISYGSNCYHLTSELKSFDFATDACHALPVSSEFGTDLVTILNPLEANYIASIINCDDEYWIGLHKHKDALLWVNGWQLGYTPNPVQIRNGTCYTVSKRSEGLIYSPKDCADNHKFICKIEKIENKIDLHDHNCTDPTVCGPGGCYFMTSWRSIAGFDKTQQACSDKMMILAEFESKAELMNLINAYKLLADPNFDDLICSLVRVRVHRPYFYVGLLKGHNKDFLHWASDRNRPVSFTNWAIGEPKHDLNSTTDILYVLIDYYGFWHTISGESQCYPGLCRSVLGQTSSTSMAIYSTTSTATLPTTSEPTSTNQPTSSTSSVPMTRITTTSNSPSTESTTPSTKRSTLIISLICVLIVIIILLLAATYRFRTLIFHRFARRYSHLIDEMNHVDDDL